MEPCASRVSTVAKAESKGAHARLTTTEDEGFVSVQRVCELDDISNERYYQLVRQKRAPKPVRGIPLKAARQWLQARAAAKAEAASAAAARLAGLRGLE
jgi:hypothetical protein